ncbi:MAG: hypothetical protein LBP87_10745 [Planctomycetaceae bacterium]|jgi:hypothetical protein|nr:hypothetical protein [Planctomycetaceae bacterium]
MNNETESEKLLKKIGKLEKITLYSVSSDDDDEPYEPGRYKICSGYLGNPYVIDTHDPKWKMWNSTINFIKFTIAILFILFCISILFCG